jgi:hypothetical protein
MRAPLIPIPKKGPAAMQLAGGAITQVGSNGMYINFEMDAQV